MKKPYRLATSFFFALCLGLACYSFAFAQEEQADQKNSQITTAEQMTLAAAAQPGQQPYNIIAKHSRMCLEIAHYGYGNGAILVQGYCRNSDNQKFFFTPAPDGTFFITAKHSGRVLDLDSGSRDNFARIQQWGIHGGENQRWRLIQADGEGYSYILSSSSDKALDVLGGNPDHYTRVIQYYLHGGFNQRFAFVPVQ